MLTGGSGHNKFGNDALHLRARRYDWVIVMEVLNQCADETSGMIIYHSDMKWSNVLGTWNDVNVLGALQDRRKQLESDVVLLAGQEEELREAAESVLFHTGHSDEYADTVPACSFWPSLEQDEMPTIADLDLGPGSPQTVILTRPRKAWAFMRAPQPPSLPKCPHCALHGLLEQRTPAGCVVLVSSWCLFCGSSSGGNVFALVNATAKPLLLIQVLLSETLRRRKSLLKLVTAAIAVVLSRLRSFECQYAIVTSQRNFFTHHGAHPPRVQPPRASGLLSGTAFQPRVAA
jgi:hypothetical protein